MAGSMMLDYLGERKAAYAVEQVVIELFKSGRLKGVGTGDHRTDEVGDLVVSEVRAVAANV